MSEPANLIEPIVAEALQSLDADGNNIVHVPMPAENIMFNIVHVPMPAEYIEVNLRPIETPEYPTPVPAPQWMTIDEADYEDDEEHEDDEDDEYDEYDEEYDAIPVVDTTDALEKRNEAYVLPTHISPTLRMSQLVPLKGNPYEKTPAVPGLHPRMQALKQFTDDHKLDNRCYVLHALDMNSARLDEAVQELMDSIYTPGMWANLHSPTALSNLPRMSGFEKRLTKTNNPFSLQCYIIPGSNVDGYSHTLEVDILGIGTASAGQYDNFSNTLYQTRYYGPTYMQNAMRVPVLRAIMQFESDDVKFHYFATLMLGLADYYRVLAVNPIHYPMWPNLFEEGSKYEFQWSTKNQELILDPDLEGFIHGLAAKYDLCHLEPNNFAGMSKFRRQVSDSAFSF